jgi:hypothetical protein
LFLKTCAGNITPRGGNRKDLRWPNYYWLVHTYQVRDDDIAELCRSTHVYDVYPVNLLIAASVGLALEDLFKFQSLVIIPLFLSEPMLSLMRVGPRVRAPR